MVALHAPYLHFSDLGSIWEPRKERQEAEREGECEEGRKARKREEREGGRDSTERARVFPIPYAC